MHRIIISLLFAVSAVLANDGRGHRLEIIASAATANVAAGASERRTVYLSGLTYSFQLRHYCRAPYAPESLLLTIADTHAFVDGTELGQGNARLTVALPPGQIPPVTVRDFCVAGAERDEKVRPLTLTSALSASASLRCSDEDSKREVEYASAALDIVLICDAETATAADPTQ